MLVDNLAASKLPFLIWLQYNSGMALPSAICDIHLICQKNVIVVWQISHSNMPRKGDLFYSVTMRFVTALGIYGQSSVGGGPSHQRAHE